MSLLAIACYSLALWMGLYLLRRNPHKDAMRYSGAGLISYAAGLILAGVVPDNPELARWQTLVAVLPALCWLAAIRALYAGDLSGNLRQRPLALIFTATIFFALGLALLFLPQPWFTQDVVLIAVGLDLLLLGFAIASLDASDEGEALLPEMSRSFLMTLAGVVLFGGQVVMVSAIEGASPALDGLLLGVVTAVILLPWLIMPLQNLLDRRLFPPRMQEERAELQAVSAALARTDSTLTPAALDEREFARLTRRALGHLGDLERLAASPLIRLPQIDARLAKSQRPDSTLARAAELKLLLIERIEHLKPPDSAYGTSDAWRYYNALYYPYVVGLKPYSRRLNGQAEDAATKTVLDWFQAVVPERTLHNWQNKAADLIARDLREMNGTD